MLLSIGNVCSAEKLTKRNSNTLMCLVSFSAEQTLYQATKTAVTVSQYLEMNYYGNFCGGIGTQVAMDFT